MRAHREMSKTRTKVTCNSVAYDAFRFLEFLLPTTLSQFDFCIRCSRPAPTNETNNVPETLRRITKSNDVYVFSEIRLSDEIDDFAFLLLSSRFLATLLFFFSSLLTSRLCLLSQVLSIWWQWQTEWRMTVFESDFEGAVAEIESATLSFETRPCTGAHRFLHLHFVLHDFVYQN